MAAKRRRVTSRKSSLSALKKAVAKEVKIASNKMQKETMKSILQKYGPGPKAWQK